MPQTTNAYYGPQAYKPDTLERMPEYSNWLYTCRWLYDVETLPWGHYLNLEQADTLLIPPAKGLLDVAGSVLPVRVWRVDHAQLKYKSLNFLTLFAYMGLAFYVAEATLQALVPIGGEVRLSSIQGFFAVLASGLFGMCLLALLYKFLAFPATIVFDRPSGMVCIKRMLRPAFTSPFVHFDPFLTTSSKEHLFGGLLRNRYRKAGMPFISRVASPGSVYVHWQFIQRFMDVTQPLPDIPLLEPCRKLDPVTAAHDKARNRPERYWRDKSKQAIATMAETLRSREEPISPQWPCALAACIEGRDPHKPLCIPPEKTIWGGLAQ